MDETCFYVCDWRDPAKLKITDYVTRFDAEANCPSEGGAAVIGSEDDLKELTSEILVSIYNHLRRGGPAITAFEKPDVGVARVWNLLQAPRDLAVGEQTDNTTADMETSDMATKPKKVKATKVKAPKATKAKAPKVAKPKAAKTPKAPKAKKAPKGDRGAKVAKLKSMLLRKSGVTRAEVLEALGWKAISFQDNAKKLGLKLTKSKEKGKKTLYFGAEK